MENLLNRNRGFRKENLLNQNRSFGARKRPDVKPEFQEETVPN